jgi:hypothetical protein
MYYFGTASTSRHVISFEAEETNVRWKRISVFPLIKLQLYERCLCK